MNRYYVDPQRDRILREDLFLVRLEKENGEILRELEPKQLFPMTRPNEYISLLEDGNREVAVIRSLQELSAESAQALEDCFREIYLIPKIRKVTHCSAKFGTMNFTVETDKGIVSFRIRNTNSDIKTLGNRILFRDSNDNRYELPDIRKLDAQSLKLLYPYI